jgi:WD40 repeat protein
MLRACDGRLLAEILAHDGGISCVRWSPRPALVEGQQVAVLATSSLDRRVRLWRAPSVE